jgi:hypothetical protein
MQTRLETSSTPHSKVVGWASLSPTVHTESTPSLILVAAMQSPLPSGAQCTVGAAPGLSALSSGHGCCLGRSFGRGRWVRSGCWACVRLAGSAAELRHDPEVQALDLEEQGGPRQHHLPGIDCRRSPSAARDGLSKHAKIKIELVFSPWQIIKNPYLLRFRVH